MNYQKYIDKIINYRRKYPLNKKDNIYCEYHHIIPICCNGANTPKTACHNKDGENIIGLTAKEHRFIHLLLWLNAKHNGQYSEYVHKLRSAFIIMSTAIPRKIKQKYRNVSKGLLYEKARVETSNYMADLRSEIVIDPYTHDKTTLKKLAKKYNIKYPTLHRRIHDYKMTLKEAISKPIRISNNLYDYNGKKLTLRQISKLTNISYNRLLARMKSGKSLSDSLNMGKPQFKLYEYNGKKYRLFELAKILNISEGNLLRKIKDGIHLDLIKIKAHKKIIENPKTHEKHSIKEWCDILNRKYETVKARIHRGWDSWKAITITT